MSTDNLTDRYYWGINFNKCLRELREKEGISQEALASASGVSQSTISAVELNDRQPSAFILDCLLISMGHKLVIVKDDKNV